MPEVREGRVKRREGSTLEEGPGADMLNRILGGKVWENGKYRELKDVQEEKVVRECRKRHMGST